MHTVETKFLDTVKTHLVGLPLLGGALVAADVNIVVREDCSYMAKNTLEEINDAVVANVENIMRDTAIDAHLVLLGGIATELRI